MAYGGIIGQGVDIGSSLDVGLYCWAKYKAELFIAQDDSNFSDSENVIRGTYSSRIIIGENGKPALENPIEFSGDIGSTLVNKYAILTNFSNQLVYIIRRFSSAGDIYYRYNSVFAFVYPGELLEMEYSNNPSAYSSGYISTEGNLRYPLGKIGEPPYVIGSYVGDGSAYKVINLGFTPRAIYVTNVGVDSNYTGRSKGFCTQKYPVGFPRATSYYALMNDTLTTNELKIVEDGFICYYDQEDSVDFNIDGSHYVYIAYK